MLGAGDIEQKAQALSLSSKREGSSCGQCSERDVVRGAVRA